MISGKSMILIRAACSVTGASAAASLGHETRPLSIQATFPKPRKYPLPINTGERPSTTQPTLPSSTASDLNGSSTPTTDEWSAFNAATLPAANDADRLDAFNNALRSIPNDVVDEVVGCADSVSTVVGEESNDASVLRSVRYWAQLMKNFNGLYASGSGDKDADDLTEGVEASTNYCPTEEFDVEEEKVGAKAEADRTPQVCRFCQSLPNRMPSPTSFKNTTLNTVTASRHLFLVRHGQYHNNQKLEKDRRLTRIGREQLKHTGNRLREIGVTYSKLISSTMKRAQESAEIILNHIGNSDLPMESDSLLEEGAPIVPEPPLPNWTPNQKQYQTDGERIETAFRKYFRKADNSQSNDVNEIIVCHANVIRYFVCRALEVQPEAWLRMWLNHGSITWLTIKPSGRVVLNAMGASGYMPPSRLTAT